MLNAHTPCRCQSPACPSPDLGSQAGSSFPSHPFTSWPHFSPGCTCAPLTRVLAPCLVGSQRERAEELLPTPHSFSRSFSVSAHSLIHLFKAQKSRPCLIDLPSPQADRDPEPPLQGLHAQAWRWGITTSLFCRFSLQLSSLGKLWKGKLQREVLYQAGDLEQRLWGHLQRCRGPVEFSNFRFLGSVLGGLNSWT